MVRIKILDQTGHTELLVEPHKALEAIREHAPDGEWVFIDGRYVELDGMEGALGGHAEVVITPAIQAG